jgi:hypothetical protein
LFSLSAKANARGTSCPSRSTATAIINVPLYLPVKKVAYTIITGQQSQNAIAHWGKHQNTLYKNMLVNTIC